MRAALVCAALASLMLTGCASRKSDWCRPVASAENGMQADSAMGAQKKPVAA